MYYQARPTPQMLLADSSWRLRNSLWMLAVILGCGMLTWAAFLYIGMRARNKIWLGAAAVYAVLFIGFIVCIELAGPSSDEIVAGATRTPTEETINSWASGLLVATWIGGIVHAGIVRRQYLQWRAQNAAPWWEGSPATNPVYPPPLYYPPVQHNSTPAAPLFDNRHYWGPPQPAPAVNLGKPAVRVDVNRAGHAELAGLGLDETVVTELLAARERRGGFTSMQEFAAAAGLKPHELSAVSDRITLTPPPPVQQHGFQARGRRLDL